MRPSGALTIDGVLRPEDRERMRGLLDKLAGAQQAGRYVLLEAGMKWTPFGMSSVDAEFLASRKFATEEIARIFCIPASLLQSGDRTPTDMPGMIASFAQLCLSPIVAAIEAEFDHAVLPPGYHLQLDMSGLLRGNYSAVMAANAVACRAAYSHRMMRAVLSGFPPMRTVTACAEDRHLIGRAMARGCLHCIPHRDGLQRAMCCRMSGRIKVRAG